MQWSERSKTWNAEHLENDLATSNTRWFGLQWSRSYHVARNPSASAGHHQDVDWHSGPEACDWHIRQDPPGREWTLGMLSWHICQHLTLPASPGRELLQSCCACTSSPPSSNWNSSNMEKQGETNGSCYIFWRIPGYFSSPQRQQTHNNSSMNSPRLSETTYPAPFLSSWELNKTRKWGNSLKCAQQFWGKVVFLVAVY